MGGRRAARRGRAGKDANGEVKEEICEMVPDCRILLNKKPSGLTAGSLHDFSALCAVVRRQAENGVCRRLIFAVVFIKEIIVGGIVRPDLFNAFVRLVAVFKLL